MKKDVKNKILDMIFIIMIIVLFLLSQYKNNTIDNYIPTWTGKNIVLIPNIK